jgi:hypothetical protein
MSDRSPENPRLEAAMAGVAENDTPENRRRLYEELIGGSLIAPVHGRVGQTGWKKLEKDTDLELVIGEDDDGNPTLPAFTSETALARWGEKVDGFVGLPGRELFRIAVELKVRSVAINPAGPIGGQLLPGELRTLAQGQVPELSGAFVETITISKLGPLDFKAPRAAPPEEFLERIRDRCAAYPEVRRAYLFSADMGDAREHVVIGIEFARYMNQAEAKNVFKELGSSIGPIMGTNEMVDFMDLKAMGVLAEIASLVPAVFARG